MKKKLILLLVSLLIGAGLSFSSHFIIKSQTYLPAPNDGLCFGTQDEIGGVGSCLVDYTKIIKSGLPLRFYTETDTVQGNVGCINSSRCYNQENQQATEDNSLSVIKYLADVMLWWIIVITLSQTPKLKNRLKKK